MIWSICSDCRPALKTYLSGYCVRAGSVFGSHWSFLTRVSDLPIVYCSILYGPVGQRVLGVLRRVADRRVQSGSGPWPGTTPSRASPGTAWPS